MKCVIHVKKRRMLNYIVLFVWIRIKLMSIAFSVDLYLCKLVILVILWRMWNLVKGNNACFVELRLRKWLVALSVSFMSVRSVLIRRWSRRKRRWKWSEIIIIVDNCFFYLIYLSQLLSLTLKYICSYVHIKFIVW